MGRTSSDAPVIAVQGLHHRYGARVIYEQLSLNVPRGKVVALLGKNGVGKTTLIKILMGFLTPHAGRCTVLGDPSHALTTETRRRVGLLFEGHVAYDFMSIAEIERFYAPFYPRWRRELYWELVGRMGLPDNHRIARMSEGQRSQVVLGLLMAQQPDLLILDDYSMGLDAGYRRLFVDLMAEYLDPARGERTVFLTSHVIQDMERFVDDIILLERGGVARQCALKDFLCQFNRYSLPKTAVRGGLQAGGGAGARGGELIKNAEEHAARWELFSFASLEALRATLREQGHDATDLQQLPMTLEDAFIGYTGRY
ncbi:ABC transporter ATP-binding protein [Megalodesulfovibrio paquesii]